MSDHSKRLGEERIAPLLARMSIPAMTGLLVQAVYNLTDAFFVGRGVGSTALAGITIALPVQLIVIAVAQTFGIGGSSIISRSLGVGDKDRANRTLGTLISLTAVSSILIAILGTVFLSPLLRLFGSTETILPEARAYLQVILWGGPFFMFAMATSAAVRAEGNARVAMLTMVISGLLNIGLDPLFIYVFKLGVAGAAWATVISQATTVLFLILYLATGRSTFRVRLRDFIPVPNIVRESFAIGAGSFARMVAGSFAVAFINRTLGMFGGDAAITTYGIINRLFQFLFMPMFGIIQGMMPIVGYNYGARSMARARHTIRLANIVTTVMSVAATLLLFLIPGWLLGLFTKDPEVIDLGTQAIRVVIVALPTVGFQIVAGGVFQALGRAMPAFILALLRQVILLMPLIWILRETMGLAGVWTAFPIADGVSAIVSAILFFRVSRTLREPLSPVPPA